MDHETYNLIRFVEETTVHRDKIGSQKRKSSTMYFTYSSGMNWSVILKQLPSGGRDLSLSNKDIKNSYSTLVHLQMNF